MTDSMPDLGPDKSLLVVDDDEPFRRRLARAMEKRGFEVVMAESVAQGLTQVRTQPPAYAVVDLRLEDGNGLDVVETLRGVREDARIVVLTGYGAIATAVALTTAVVVVVGFFFFSRSSCFLDLATGRGV